MTTWMPRSKCAPLCLTLAALINGGLAGCTPDFAKVWQVDDLRLLAIQADPPEVLVPLGAIPVSLPPVRVSVLAVEPRESAGGGLDRLGAAEIDWEVWACTPEEDQCIDASTSVKLFERRSRLDQISFEYVASPELLVAAIGADLFRGFGGVPIILQIHLKGAEQVIGVKRLVYGFVDPPAKAPNRNPELLRVDAGDPPGEIPADWTPAPGEVVQLRPVVSKDIEGAADNVGEPYVVRTFTGGTRELEEALSYSFFATGGDLSHARTGGKASLFFDNRKTTDVSAEWTVPEQAGTGAVWVVVRDDRGGVDWRRYDFEAR